VQRNLVILSVIGALLVPGGTAIAQCLKPKERTAVHVRMLQTELMVAALSCRAVPGRDFTAEYNSFVRKHGDRLVGHARVLQAYFSSTYGSESRRHLDAFITSLANDASRRSMSSPTFCDESVGLFHEALQVERSDLESWSAMRLASVPVALSACGAEGRASSAPAR
jgi:hypothetical protein